MSVAIQRIALSAATATVLAQLGCVDAAPVALELDEPELLAAALLETDEAGAFRALRFVPVEGGRLADAASPVRLDGELYLVTVRRAEVLDSAFGLDLSRLAEARITRASAGSSCRGEGEVEGDRLSLELAARASIQVYDAGSRAFRPVTASGSETAAALLAQLRLELPARASFECEVAPRIEVVRALAHGALMQAQDTFDGQVVTHLGLEAVELRLLGDGRLVGVSTRFMVLRRPEDPYRDDPREVLRLHTPDPNDPYQRRGGVHLREDDGAGAGELWFLSTTTVASGRRTRLEAVRFSPAGFGARRVLSELPVRDDVGRMQVHPSGAVVVLLKAGGVWYAPGPAGPWRAVDAAASPTQLLVPYPGRARAYFSADSRGAFILELPEVAGPELSPRISAIGPAAASIAKVLGGFALRDALGTLSFGVSGEGGFVTLGAAEGVGARWRRFRPDIDARLGRRCAGATACGRPYSDRHVFGAHPLELDGERWLLLAVDLCDELIALRLSDGCTTGIPPPTRSQAEPRGQFSRRFLAEGGRLFLTRHEGALDEILVR